MAQQKSPLADGGKFRGAKKQNKNFVGTRFEPNKIVKTVLMKPVTKAN